MNKPKVVKGYKVFNPDWTCREKQYTCPGKFEEDVIPSICGQGMHFCKEAADCFSYYRFDSNNPVAEVAAYGTVVEKGNKCCTDKLEIVRKISWHEVLKIVNTGKDCTGIHNTGNWNSGNGNSGYYNSGNRNSGNNNSGSYNSGYCNSGNCNSGHYNTGKGNSGHYNTGNWNTGNWNSGDRNTGDRNTGDWNTGDWNTGNWNTGDWNKCSFSNGCFNTTEPKIYLFNKPSDWTYRDWRASEACRLLLQIPGNAVKYVRVEDMTEEEKTAHPEAETTGGYLKKPDNAERAAAWWRELSDAQKRVITEIPNFDKVIFKEITGIDVD